MVIVATSWPPREMVKRLLDCVSWSDDPEEMFDRKMAISMASFILFGNISSSDDLLREGFSAVGDSSAPDSDSAFASS